VVLKNNADGTFDVKCDDGSVKKNTMLEELRASPPEFFEGDRVASASNGVSGVVLRKNNDGSLYVKFDNGTTDKHARKSSLVSAKPDLFVGDSVEGRAQTASSKPVLPGKITKHNADGTYEVKYADGKVDKTVFRRDLRPAVPVFVEGEKVDVRAVSVGTVIKKNANGTVDIKLANGKELKGVSLDAIQPSKLNFGVGDKISIDKVGAVPGVVVNRNTDGTVDVKYANGELVKGVQSSSLQSALPGFAVGDKVDFSNTASQVGKVAKRNDDGSVDVLLDDGRVQQKVNKKLLTAPSNGFFAAGETVEMDPTGRGDWVPGVVVKSFADGTYEIDYDIPAQKSGPEVDGIASHGRGALKVTNQQQPQQYSGSRTGASSRAKPPLQKEFARGSSVVANHKAEGNWLPGKIHRSHGNGTYDIIFDSGVAEAGVPSEYILPSVPSKRLENSYHSDSSASRQQQAQSQDDPVQISIKLPASVTQPGLKTFNYNSPNSSTATGSTIAPTASQTTAATTSTGLSLDYPTDTLPAAPVMTARSLMMPSMRRRKMHVENLTLLDPAKRLKLVKMLKKKGRFMQISRKMLEDARAKYSNSSLKNKVDYLESELKTLNANQTKMRHVLKKNHNALKDSLPPNFDHIFSNMSVLLNAVQSIGGPSALIHNIENASRKKDKRHNRRGRHGSTVDPYDDDDEYNSPTSHAETAAMLEDVTSQKRMTSSLAQQIEELKEKLENQEKKLNELPEPDDIVKYNQGNNLVDKDIAYITDKLRSTILHEYQLITSAEIAKLKDRLIDFSSDAFTRSDLSKMLQPPHLGGFDPGLTGEAITDPNHTKLVNLINRSVDLYYQKVELAKKQYSTISMGPSSKDLEDIALAGQKHTDQRLKKMMEVVKTEIENVHANGRSRADKLDVDIAMIQENMNSLLSNQMNLMKVSMDMETRKRESAIIKDLQKKMAAYSTDKLIDDIKILQKDMREKPSATKVSEMLALVEHSFTSNIGAGMVGMRSYIEQLYKAVQHKVNREDIRALINAKVAQLEQELVHKEEDMYSIASSTRCLSCGQSRGEVSIKKLHRIGEDHPNDNMSAVSMGSAKGHSHSNGVVMDDELSLPDHNDRFKGAHSAPSLGLQVASDEEIQSLLSGQAGLRPLLAQHNPLQMSATVPHQQPASTGSKKKGDKLPDPLYLKAKLAAHMKEMVKSDVNLKKQGGPVYVLEDNNSSNNGSSDSHSVGSTNRGGYMGQNRAIGSSKAGPSSSSSSLTGTTDGLLPPIAPAANSSKLNTYF